LGLVLLFLYDTWITSKEGFNRIDYLSNCSNKKCELWKIKLTNGMVISLNPQLKIKTVSNQTRYQQQFDWKWVNEVQINDLIAITNNRKNNIWSGIGDFEEGWLIGEIIGDGCLQTKSNHAYLCFWGKNQGYMADIAVKLIKQKYKVRTDLTGYHVRDYKIVQISLLSKLTKEFGLEKKEITYEIESTSSSFYRGFLRGLFDSDGSVQGTQEKGISVRLAQSNLTLLLCIQRMLNRLGIISTVYENRRKEGKLQLLPDGKGGHKLYPIKAQHELCITKDNLTLFLNLIGFFDMEKNEKLHTSLNNYKRTFNRERFSSKVKSIETVEEYYFDILMDENNEKNCNGFLIRCN
jgi:ribonucleotide reductase class II